MSVPIPKDFGYVLLVIGLSWFLNIYLMALVVRARKQYKVPYPTLYADKDHKDHDKFNSVQRAHQNTLESWAPIQILMVVDGLLFPKAAAAFGLVWVLSRFLYGFGYSRSGPKGRMVGVLLSHLGTLPLIFLSLYAGAVMAELV
eukprot:EG_transcript_32658